MRLRSGRPQGGQIWKSALRERLLLTTCRGRGGWSIRAFRSHHDRVFLIIEFRVRELAEAGHGGRTVCQKMHPDPYRLL